MQIISKPTTTDILYRWVADPVAFAREVGTDYDPVPCQQTMLRSPIDSVTSITSKARQRGASETVCHFVAWCLFAKPADWKCYVVAPNQWVSEENLNRIVGIYESTPLLKDNLRGCTRNDTEFRLAQKQSKVEVLLVGDSAGNARRGGTIKRGLLWFEELTDIPKADEVVQSLTPFADWGLGSTSGIIYTGTKRGHSGAFYRKYRYIEQRVKEGNPGYRIFSFPLIQFIRERHGQGISVASLRERKAEVPRHTWLNEYMARFCEPDAEFFAGEDVRRSWQVYQHENIQLEPSMPLYLGIDWGLRDATALIYCQDNLVDDRLEVVKVETFRQVKYAKEHDRKVNSYEDIVRAICRLRDRGYDPEVVYSDKNNKGGVYSDQLKNVHGFNVVDGSWGGYEKKTKALRSLRNLIGSGRFLFPADPRLLLELSRFSPTLDGDRGKYSYREHNDDCIAAMAMIAAGMDREAQPPTIAVATSDHHEPEQWQRVGSAWEGGSHAEW